MLTMALDRNEAEGTWIPKCDLCAWTGEPELEQGKAQTQYLNHCKTQEHKENKRIANEESAGKGDESKHPPPSDDRGGREKTPPGEPPQPQAPKQDGRKKIEELREEDVVLFYGAEGMKYLKRKKMEQLLTLAPGVSDDVREWVLTNYDQDPAAQSDYNALYNLLIASKVHANFAQRIVQILITIEQKYMQPQAQYGAYFPNFAQPPQDQQFMYFPGAGAPGQPRPIFHNPYAPSNQGYPPGLYYPQPQNVSSPVSKEIERIEKTVEDLRKAVQASLNPPPPPEKGVNREDIQTMIESGIEKALSKPSLTKEDVVEVVKTMVIEKEQGDTMKDILEKVKDLKDEVRSVRNNPTISKDLSEEGNIEIKKLDVIGNKLDNFHDTVKTGISLLLQDEKPKSRTLEDITHLDTELERVAKDG